MSEPLWKLLLAEPPDLDCDQCIAVMDFYAGLLAERGPEVLPDVLQHLRGCPTCSREYHEALHRLEATYGDEKATME